MEIIFAAQQLIPSIFLAGPTPRSDDVKSWRPEAIDILEKLNFEGKVFVPEAEDWKTFGEYYEQINWEKEAIKQASVVAFWVPRDLETLPGFTTNVEFGMLVTSRKVLLGFPHGSPKMKYLEALAMDHNIPLHDSLKSLLTDAMLETYHRTNYTP